MKILLIDTTTRDLIVSVVTENEILDGSIYNLGTQHSEKLCNVVEQFLQNNNLSLSDMDAFACSIGPGSFTGIRIGVSTVKGYNLALDKKLIQINTLQAISISHSCGAKGSAVIDAGNGYYFADYINNIEPCLIPYDDVRVGNAGSAKFASEYFDGLVKLCRDNFEQGNFDINLSPLYIRKSQAEENVTKKQL